MNHIQSELPYSNIQWSLLKIAFLLGHKLKLKLHAHLNHLVGRYAEKSAGVH